MSGDASERWSSAEVVLLFAWAVLAVGLLAWAMARTSIGAGVLGGFALWMLSSAWTTGPAVVRDRRGL